MKKNRVIALIFIGSLLIGSLGYAAVTSIGEINAVGETRGIVPSHATVPLIVTLIIDRSLAELGEEIKTIEIIMPPGFLTEPSYFKGILRDGTALAAKAVVSGESVLRVELEKIIDDYRNSIYTINFDCRTSSTVAEAAFRVRLRNEEDNPIGEFIREGQADGKLNNDDFTLQVIPNVPPLPVKGFNALPDTTGENDVILRWQKSDDTDVTAYAIYRNQDKLPILTVAVEKHLPTTVRDVNVPPGTHTYQITAIRQTIHLQSQRSPIRTVNVPEDTAPPRPPASLEINVSRDGVELTWPASSSPDVTKYQIFFAASIGALEPLPTGEIDAEPPEHRPSGEIRAVEKAYKFLDPRQLAIGNFTYAVAAIDEAGNSASITERLRIFDRPYPNPFTPLSPDSDFNTVIFPIRAIDDAVGEFSVLLFNLNGALVKTLTAQLGETALKWDGKDENGEIVESGVYIYQLQVGDSFKTGTVILVK